MWYLLTLLGVEKTGRISSSLINLALDTRKGGATVALSGVTGISMARSRIPRLNPEQKFHITVAQYLDLALPAYCAWTTFPAGGGGKLRGSFLKRMGLKAGWPDIQILWQGNFIGLELKAPGKVPTDAQYQCHKWIKAAGGNTHVVKSLDEIYGVLKAHNIPLTAKP